MWSYFRGTKELTHTVGHHYTEPGPRIVRDKPDGGVTVLRYKVPNESMSVSVTIGYSKKCI